jgi:hypothetical protein
MDLKSKLSKENMEDSAPVTSRLERMRRYKEKYLTLKSKPSKDHVKDAPSVSEEKEPKDIAVASDLDASSLRRKMLDWRDKHYEEIELHLSMNLPKLMKVIDAELEKLSVIESTVKMKSSSAEKIQPVIEKWIDQESELLIKRANSELSDIYGEIIEYQKSNAGLEFDADVSYGGEVSVAAAASLSGVALIPVVTSASVISTGGLLGLFGATTISLPIVAVGTIAVGAALALGGHRFLSLKERAQAGYRENIEASIEDFVLSRGKDKERGLTHQLQSEIKRTCNKILASIEAC